MPFRAFLVAVAALVSGCAIWGYANATADPIVRQLIVRSARYPRGAQAIKLVLVTDVHVVGPDMPPDRLTRIVGQINRLQPDIVLLAGDFTSDRFLSTRRYDWIDAVAPYRHLAARFGKFAVLGNHDHWRRADDARAALARIGVHVLTNDAVQVGPLDLGGLDDAVTHHQDVGRTVRRMRTITGVRVLLSHSPDPFPAIPSDIGLMLAGHTHCGQIRLPLGGYLSTGSRYGARYVCGVVRENGKTLVVSAGLGTSVAPIRFGVVPDIWVITIGPPAGR